MLLKITVLILKVALIVIATAFLAYGILLATTTASNDRDWSQDLSILPYAEFNGDMVTIRNIRNNRYRSVLDYDAAYYDKTFNLNEIKSIDFIVEPFSGVAAHTLVAFGFEDGSYVDVSVEVRREKGEFFNAVKGLFRHFELTYVIADENDVLKLRTNQRKDNVYVYPIKTTKEKTKLLFIDMLERANKLKEQPEFYHTLFNNCTTNIVEHVNNITPQRVPFSYKFIFPKYSDELANDIGLFRDTGTIEELRARHNVSPAAQQNGDNPDFSKKIREGLPEYKQNSSTKTN